MTLHCFANLYLLDGLLAHITHHLAFSQIVTIAEIDSIRYGSMGPDRLEDVRRSLDAEAAGPGVLSDPEGKGFGLRNVDQRLRLYYRRDEGLVITSDDTGTIVTFTVPVRGKEELEHDESVSRG